jgi:hypothetical protein
MTNQNLDFLRRWAAESKRGDASPAVDGRAASADGAADETQPSGLWGSKMAYCWAALRTLGILVGVVSGLLVLAAIASGVVNAFLYAFETGCLVLALIFSVLALFGHQLVRVSKTPRTQRIGSFTRNCGAAGAILAMASFAVDYGYSTIHPALLAQLNGPTPLQVVADKPPFDPSKPFSAVTGPIGTTPTCDDALVSAYEAFRLEEAAAVVPPPPPGFVLDGPPRSHVVMTTHPCLTPVDGNPFVGKAVRAARVFRLEKGWEIRAPADARDEDVVRVFEALPASAILAVKSP